MTTDRPAPSQAASAGAAGVEASALAEDGPTDDEGLEDGDEYEEFEEYEDSEDDAEADQPRGWPLGTLLAITLGIWAGRWFYRLPDGLEGLAGLLLVLLTAIFAAGLYRRWVRRQFAQARARRLR